jgi:two-component system, NtrC family, sensor histidine kinase HydH
MGKPAESPMQTAMHTPWRRKRWLIVALSIFIISGLHYLTPPPLAPWHVVLLYYFPIIFAAIEFGWRGGIFTAIAAGLVCYAPHVLAWNHDPGYSAYSQYGEVTVFCLVGAVTGILSDRERRHRVELEHSVSKLKAAHDDLATNLDGLKRADRLAVLGTIAGGLAQEMKAPLEAIEGELERLDRQVSSQPGRESVFETMRDEVRRWNLLLSGLLSYARGDIQLPDTPLSQAGGSWLEFGNPNATQANPIGRKVD